LLKKKSKYKKTTSLRESKTTAALVMTWFLLFLKPLCYPNPYKFSLSTLFKGLLESGFGLPAWGKKWENCRLHFPLLGMYQNTSAGGGFGATGIKFCAVIYLLQFRNI